MPADVLAPSTPAFANGPAWARLGTLRLPGPALHTLTAEVLIVGMSDVSVRVVNVANASVALQVINITASGTVALGTLDLTTDTTFAFEIAGAVSLPTALPNRGFLTRVTSTYVLAVPVTPGPAPVIPPGAFPSPPPLAPAVGETYGMWRSFVMDATSRVDLADGRIDTVLRIVQRRVYRDLRGAGHEATVQIQSDGTSRYIALPDRFKDARSVNLAEPFRRELAYMTPEAIRDLAVWDVHGHPEAYTIEGLMLAVAPDPSPSPFALDIVYTEYPQLMSSSGDTNWILQQAYDVLVQAAIAEVYRYVMDFESAGPHEALYQQRKSDFNNQWGRMRTTGGARRAHGTVPRGLV